VGGNSALNWAAQHAVSRRARADFEAQEDPIDENTGLPRKRPAGGASASASASAAGDADAAAAVREPQLIPLPAAALAAAAASAAAAAARGDGVVAVVLIVTCNRPDYLARTLASVRRVHNGDARFPLVISQDGAHVATAAVARAAASASHGEIAFMQHAQGPPAEMESPSDNPAYYRISAHYAWALGQLFDGERAAERVIILEDDMEVAPDFFEYFAAMAQLLDADSSLWCASSWNDNGQRRFVSDAGALYRSDFFPGLGWMLTRSLWAELAPKWPAAWWDDWMRLPATRAGRQCVRPEVCRTFNFGARGASKGQFFAQYLRDVALATRFVRWSDEDLAYLRPDACAPA
jgi:alpha-1,3-mannosyl-glycoprotein beta-1,2-N-acetylglucosaminyltransferase